MSVRRIVAAALLAVPLCGIGAAAKPFAVRPALGPDLTTTDETVDVPLQGGGHVTVRVPAGGVRPVSGRRVATGPAGPRGKAGETVVTSVDPASTDESALYPPDAVLRTGTIASIGGGNCDGYPALAATVSPIRVSVAPNGDLYWLDRDLAVNKNGSLLVRTLDAQGRVRTLTSVLPPVLGRHNRQFSWWEWITSLAATNRGVYYSVSTQITNPGYTDTPISGSLNFVDRQGRVTHLAGTGYMNGADTGGYAAPRRRDGRHPMKTWLGVIESLAVDAADNIYFVEAPSYGRPIVRFFNRGTTTKVFYPGSGREVSVAPDTIGSIANDTEHRPAFTEYPVLGEQPVAASDIDLQYVPSIALRGGLLYVLNVALYNQADSGPPGTPVGHTSVHVVNLAFDRAAARVHGVTIQPGYADYVAGTPNGPQQEGGYNGDVRPARGATLNLRWSAYNGAIAIGRDGALLIADTRNHRLRSVDRDLGIITTLAGTGQPGYDPKARPILSPLWSPTGVAVDRDGSVVFVDHQNMRIRRYAGPDQPIRDVVGRGPRPCGDGRLATGRTPLGGAYFGAIADVAAASNGDVFVADGSYNQIRRITKEGRIDLTIGTGIDCAAGRYGDLDDACPAYGVTAGDGGPFELASLAEPAHLVVDSYDNLYISDYDRVRYVNFRAKPISVLGVTVQPHTIESVIVFPNRRVELVDAKGVQVGETVAPIGDVALDGHGALYVADPVLSVVYRRGPCGDLSVVAGNGVPSDSGAEGDGGPALAASISPAGDLAYDRARDVLLIYDLPLHGSPRVRGVALTRKKVTEFGTEITPDVIRTVAGGASCEAARWCSYGDGGYAVAAGLSGTGIVVTRDRLFLADSRFHRIRAVDPTGRIGVVVSPVPENTDGRLDVHPSPFDPVTPSGYGFSGDGGPALRAGIDLMVDSAFLLAVNTGMTDSGGDLVLADSGRVRLVRDAAHAPVSYRPTIPRPRIVHVQRPSFDTAVNLRDTRLKESGQDAGDTYPSLVLAGDDVYVAAARGAARGCDLWRATGDGWRSPIRLPVPADDVGLGAGGRRCGLAVGKDGVSLATDVDVAGADDGTARRLGTALLARNAGGDWSATAAPASTTDPHPIAGTSVATVGGRTVVVDADGSEVVVSEQRGGVLDRIGGVPVDAIALGDLVVDGTRLSLPIVARTGPVGPVALFVATSRDGGTTWALAKVTDVVEYAGVVEASRPSLAVSRHGVRYVTWSDERVVVLSHESAPGKWTKPLRANPPGSFGTLPSITVAPDGRPVLAYYAADAYGHAAREQRRGPIDDFTTVWEVVVTVVQGARTESMIVTTGLHAHVGQACLGPSCANDPLTERAGTSEAGRIAFGGNARDLGPVRVAIGKHGAITVAYTRDPLGGADPTSGTVVALTRECRVALLTGAALPPCQYDKPATPPPTVQPPEDGVPDLPTLTCSPLPPPFPESRARPQPRRTHRAGDALAAAGPVTAAVPLVGEPPMLPSYIAGHAPAHNVNTNQLTENVTAQQPGSQGQFGAVFEERDEIAPVAEYAFAALVASAAAAFAWRSRNAADVAAERSR